jgi:hypothetical protein
MTEHDPIREWSAQKERVQEMLEICNTVRMGDMEPGLGKAMLQVAGIPEALADLAIASIVIEPRTAATTEPTAREPVPGERVRWSENDTECTAIRVDDHHAYGRVVWGLWDGPEGEESYVPASMVEIIGS